MRSTEIIPFHRDFLSCRREQRDPSQHLRACAEEPGRNEDPAQSHPNQERRPSPESSLLSHPRHGGIVGLRERIQAAAHVAQSAPRARAILNLVFDLVKLIMEMLRK